MDIGHHTQKADDSALPLLVDERFNGTVEPRIVKENLLKIVFQPRRVRAFLTLQELPVKLRYPWNIVFNKSS